MITTMPSHSLSLEKFKLLLRWLWLHRPNLPIPWRTPGGWMLLYADDMGWGALRPYEKPIVDWVKTYVKPGMVCVDGGANQGFYTLLFLRLGANVIAYEPNIFEYRRMFRNVRLNKFGEVELSHVLSALSSGKGTRSLYTVPHHESRSSLRPPPEEVGNKGDYWDVSIVSLDEDLEKKTQERISLIKLDIEGAEREALLGARETIRKNRPALLVEIADVATQQFGYTGKELLNYITEDLGYQRILSHRGQGLNEEYYRDTMVFLPEGR